MSTHGFFCANAEFYQEALAIGMARGRKEEHQQACQVIRLGIVEIAHIRFPLIANFVQERLENIEHFAVLRQCNFVMSTAWEVDDILRFLLALNEMQAEE
jgi:hypothetical protein